LTIVARVRFLNGFCA